MCVWDNRAKSVYSCKSVWYGVFYFNSPIEQAYLPSCRDGQSQPRLLLIDQYDNVKQRQEKMVLCQLLFRTDKVPFFLFYASHYHIHQLVGVVVGSY